MSFSLNIWEFWGLFNEAYPSRAKIQATGVTVFLMVINVLDALDQFRVTGYLGHWGDYAMIERCFGESVTVFAVTDRCFRLGETFFVTVFALTGGCFKSNAVFFLFSVWLGIMLPVLGMKSLSSYAIAYLERLLM